MTAERDLERADEIAAEQRAFTSRSSQGQVWHATHLGPSNDQATGHWEKDCPGTGQCPIADNPRLSGHPEPQEEGCPYVCKGCGVLVTEVADTAGGVTSHHWEEAVPVPGYMTSTRVCDATFGPHEPMQLDTPETVAAYLEGSL